MLENRKENGKARRPVLLVFLIALPVLLAAAAVFALAASGCIKPEKHSFDYTGDIEKVKSIEIIEVTKPADYEDEFGCRVVSEVSPDKWSDALSRIAALEYTQPFGMPPEVRGGDTVILVRFEQPNNGVSFLMFGYKCPGAGEIDGSRVRIRTHPYWCDRHEFETLLSDLG